MDGEDRDERATDRRSPAFAERMLEEARDAAIGDDGPDAVDDAAAAAEPEPGTVADTGEPAGTADAHAAGVMDTAGEDCA
jgi:hypothetical protein